jgi:hypothetical protein
VKNNALLLAEERDRLEDLDYVDDICLFNYGKDLQAKGHGYPIMLGDTVFERTDIC